jgi:imidazolonepropionase-like amidohydrolase
MRMMVCLFLLGGMALGQTPSTDVQQYIKINEPTFALTHVRIIDGTGAAPREDQTAVVTGGKIVSIGPSAGTAVPAGTKTFDESGHTIFPGIVGMHNHLFYSASIEEQAGAEGNIAPPGFLVAEVPFSAPRLYLAAGVTTMRTTGNVEGYTDLRVKKLIDQNQMPGPKIDATAPYLEGAGTFIAQLHELTGPEDARKTVAYWADEGATSYKAYMFITRAELGAAIQEAHARKLKVTGHLCSVTWREAIQLGIDDLEHGPVFTDTEFATGKQPDKCVPGESSWEKQEITGTAVQDLIRDLVAHHVAVTSTLPVFEASLPGRPAIQQRVMDAMSPGARASYLARRARISPTKTENALLFKKEMDFEHAFAKAGGLLLAGPDPTGNGGVLPGFGDQREIELLVEAGFTPLEAIQIATQNGAKYLGIDDRTGTIVVGKQADMVVVKGDPSKKIEDIENVETVFKNGVGFDSVKLIDAVRGQVGIR